jgi:esterase/lipase superfamily enzyme
MDEKGLSVTSYLEKQLMELIDPIVLLSLGAGAAAVASKDRVSPGLKDAYTALKNLIKQRYPKVSIEQLEQAPDSENRLAIIEEELTASGAGGDLELFAAAYSLIRLLLPHYNFGTSLGAVTVSARRSRSAIIRTISLKITEVGAATDAEYVVWYGTNRSPKAPGDESKGYSARRDTGVHYGSCRVFIPKSHKIGSTGSPWWKRVLTGKDDRLRLRSIEALDSTAYWRAISAQIASVNGDENFAVVFVHGYNVSFEEAALCAAQIGFDLSIQSAMAFFSWPSRGTLKGYLADAAAIEASESAITDFLIDFGNLSGAQTVHIIAHSMGNRAVLRALHRIAERARRRSKTKFGQIILAAADVDTDVFRQFCAAVVRVGQRTTLYVSARDVAIGASRWLHDSPRAGLMPPVVVEKGIDTINVTNIDLTRLGHGYIAGARDVLRDIHELIARGTPPRQRFGLRNARTEDGRHYWVIGA